MSTVQSAYAIASEAHKGQMDKGGTSYILHPIRVMLAMTSDDARVVALLHDVVEDCPEWTLERLDGEGFAPDVIAGIDAVTRRKGEGYGDFVRRCAANPLGRIVKEADLRDNINLSRIPNPTNADRRRVARYYEALQILNEARK